MLLQAKSDTRTRAVGILQANHHPRRHPAESRRETECQNCGNMSAKIFRRWCVARHNTATAHARLTPEISQGVVHVLLRRKPLAMPLRARARYREQGEEYRETDTRASHSQSSPFRSSRTMFAPPSLCRLQPRRREETLTTHCRKSAATFATSTRT